jgi:uncharacterized phage-like protein YoqJ
MVITFLGHSSLYITDDLRHKILRTIKNIIHQGEKVSFYCGGYGDFDNLYAGICRSVKKENPSCEVIFITPYMTESQQQKIKEWVDEKLYDSVIYPPLETIPPRVAIVKRNEWMIQKADFIIAYVKHTYGGAYRALKYADKKKKSVINLAEKDM